MYTNAGIAKHYSYDSAIVGTSLTENSAPSLYDELFGGEWIKLVTSGGTAHNHAILMDVAFRTREMKRIVYGLDIYSFIAEKDETAQDVPMYLYDDNPFNDVSYLLNKDILFDRLYETYQYNAEGLTYLTRDSMYYWGGNYEFSEEEVLKGVNPTAGAHRPVGHQHLRTADERQPGVQPAALHRAAPGDGVPDLLPALQRHGIRAHAPEGAPGLRAQHEGSDHRAPAAV